MIRLLIVAGAAISLVACASGPGPIVPKTRVERQMIGLLEKFDRWDLDGNGRLTRPELKEAEKLSGQSADKILGFYDTNHDGGVTLSEAQAGFERTDEAEAHARKP